MWDPTRTGVPRAVRDRVTAGQAAGDSRRPRRRDLMENIP